MRDTFTRRVVTVAALGLLVISLRLAWGVSGEFPVNLGDAALAQGSECAVVTEITGRGNQTSEPFDITGQTFTLDYEATSPSGEGFAFFNVLDENAGIIQPASQDLSTDDPTRLTGNASFDSGPGSYTIEIAAADADYNATVRDCGQQNSGGGGGGDPLLQAGGPTNGPVPPMPGGGCPTGFPVAAGGGCPRT